MSLLLRYSPAEGVLRSVGDPPNGIVGLLHEPPGLPRFVITPTFEPTPEPEGTEKLELVINHPRDELTEVETTVAVRACEDVRVARLLWRSAASNLKVMLPAMLEHGDVEAIEVECAFLRELREAIWAAFGDA